MRSLKQLDEFFEKRKDYGVIFLRLIIGWRLIDGAHDNVFSWERMLEFQNFLSSNGVQFPLVAAVVSVYAQFICGSMYILGAWIRIAAVVMIVNFLAALYIAHIGLTFEQSFDALMMLFGSIFFLFNGAGKFAVDNLLKE